MKRIIVGIDGSPQSTAALRISAQLARDTQAELQLVHVSPEAEVTPLGEPALVSAQARWIEEQDKRAKAVMAAAIDVAKGVPAEPVIKAGSPAEVLSDLAKDPEVTMVVVGHRGRNLAARLLIGSVADRLVQISPKPVLVVR